MLDAERWVWRVVGGKIGQRAFQCHSLSPPRFNLRSTLRRTGRRHLCRSFRPRSRRSATYQMCCEESWGKPPISCRCFGFPAKFRAATRSCLLNLLIQLLFPQ
jgi:hypothetical protein